MFEDLGFETVFPRNPDFSAEKSSILALFVLRGFLENTVSHHRLNVFKHALRDIDLSFEDALCRARHLYRHRGIVFLIPADSEFTAWHRDGD